MFGRDRHRLAEAEREEYIRVGAAPFGFVDDEDHVPAAAAQQLREFAIRPEESGARIDQEQHGIDLAQRRDRLLAHAMREAAALGFVEPGRVDDGEAQIAERGRRLAAVAGHARQVVDERELLAGEAVE